MRFRLFKPWVAAIAAVLILASVVYHELWGKHVYLVTAYCDCAICINIPKYRDGQFANGKKVHWGGIAADPKVPFGTELELVPFWPFDFWKIKHVLNERQKFRVEDRGGKIKGKHIDIFIPQSMGGHQTALEWGAQRMRVRMNGELVQ